MMSMRDAVDWIVLNYDELQKGAGLGDIYCGEVIRAYRARLQDMLNPITSRIMVAALLRLWRRTEFHVAS
jgi:hypothetical protein